jgi:hypothetical protein
MDKLELQTNLTFYPVPDLAYVCTVRGKFMLNRLSLFEVIQEVPPYFYKFLRYALGRELRSYYPSSSWDQIKEDEYQAMLKHIKASTEINILINTDPILMHPWQGSYTQGWLTGVI